jgi:Leu/Phe-tRNA-protein transferase
MEAVKEELKKVRAELERANSKYANKVHKNAIDMKILSRCASQLAALRKAAQAIYNSEPQDIGLAFEQLKEAYENSEEVGRAHNEEVWQEGYDEGGVLGYDYGERDATYYGADPNPYRKKT